MCVTFPCGGYVGCVGTFCRTVESPSPHSHPTSPSNIPVNTFLTPLPHPSLPLPLGHPHCPSVTPTIPPSPLLPLPHPHYPSVTPTVPLSPPLPFTPPPLPLPHPLTPLLTPSLPACFPIPGLLLAADVEEYLLQISFCASGVCVWCWGDGAVCSRTLYSCLSG